MKKKLLLGLLATACAFADLPVSEEVPHVHAAHGYVSLGLGPFPLPLPFVGIGGRFQSGHHGADVSLQGITFGKHFTLLKENVNYLHYFTPSKVSQFYMGAGLAVTEAISRKECDVALSPQFIAGKEYTSDAGGKRFFQAQLDPVFLDTKSGKWDFFPSLILSYGFCF